LTHAAAGHNYRTPALVTPFRNGQLDRAALEGLVARQLAAGVDGLVPCGTTGEAPTLSHEEMRAVVETVIGLARPAGVPVIAGAGSYCTATALELARTCAACGADALLVVSPYYNRPSQEGLYRHFSAIAQSTALPIVLYNIPGRTGVEITIDTLKRLFDAHRNIVAVKHATGSVGGAADLAAACSIPILSGDDPLTLPLMAQGAVGVISVVSNLFPRAVKRLTDAARAGAWTAAQQAHRELYAAAKALLSLDTNPVPVKTALALRGWCAEEFRLPLCPLAAEKRDALAQLLQATHLE
jgi:4-hydroxy-tetrahydrodipicolinate synthase